MIRSLDDYRGIVDDAVLSEIYKKANKLSNKHIVNVNSTYQGGGVAEILHSLVILMNDVGVDAGWRILPGTPGFFTTTKRIHNALQGEDIDFDLINKEFYVDNNHRFSKFTHINHDCVIVHDPQPLPFIKFCNKKQPWVWRCHVDLSQPQGALWDYIKAFILRYDIVIISDERYRRKDLPVEQKIIYPSIDPLSWKNIDLDQKTIDAHLQQYNIPVDKSLITQISRFDKWKDPEGVIQVFLEVKKHVDCRLILCGNAAGDDPEGVEIYTNVVQRYYDHIHKGDIILITAEDNIMVNALQRASTVIVQKSTREGFSLTVTEGLWKGKAVVASNVGGIPNQIDNGKNGILVDPHNYDQCAERIIHLLQDEKYRENMGKRATEYVRKKFLITRHLLDYLNLLIKIF